MIRLSQKTLGPDDTGCGWNVLLLWWDIHRLHGFIYPVRVFPRFRRNVSGTADPRETKVLEEEWKAWEGAQSFAAFFFQRISG